MVLLKFGVTNGSNLKTTVARNGGNGSLVSVPTSKLKVLGA